jgi:hypothetical protein
MSKIKTWYKVKKNIRMARFDEQRDTVYKAGYQVSKALDKINLIENNKTEIKNSLFNGLEIKGLDTLLDGVSHINNQFINDAGGTKSNLNNIIFEIDEREREKL